MKHANVKSTVRAGTDESLNLRVTRITNRLAAVLASGVVFVFPLVYFIVGYEHLSATGKAEASFTAGRVSAFIANGNQKLWMYEDVRLRVLLYHELGEETPHNYRIVDTAGRVIVQDDTKLKSPTHKITAGIYDSGTEVGQVEVVVTLWPLMLYTVLAALFGLLLGGGILITLRVYPLRALKQTLDRLSDEKERAEVTLHSIADAVVTADINGCIQSLNPVAEQLSGWSTAEAFGLPARDVFRFVYDVARKPVDDPVGQVLSTGQAVSIELNVSLVCRDDRVVSIEASAAPIRGSHGRRVGVVLVLHDVSRTREMASKLTYQASHDALTGLINRNEFEIRLKSVIRESHDSAVQSAVCYMDLDQFKIVNDTCGHMAGDELLRQLSVLLQSRVRNRDTFARLGGDEFGLILAGCPLEQAERVAQTILHSVSTFRFNWNGQNFSVGASLGLVKIDSSSIDSTDVLSAADAACYAAKEKGGNSIYVYKHEDASLIVRRGEMKWVVRIRRAIDEHMFTLYFQPIQSLSGDGVIHYEILLRLVDDSGEIIPPGVFIPAAERYNLMPEIDRWVIAATFSAVSERRQKHGITKEIFAINLSGLSWNSDELLMFIVNEARYRNLPPEAICFEITETAAISHLSRAVSFIKELKAQGFRFSLDDFGSGVSSFGYLKQLPVDFLKIDGGFVKSMVDDKIDLAMVNVINQIGHTMGIKTIAEFVETGAILEKLRELGVDSAQGYFIAKPIPLEELIPGWAQWKLNDKLQYSKRA